MQFCTGYKSLQHVTIPLEICVTVFQLIQNVNISFDICTNVSGVCADSFKMLIFRIATNVRLCLAVNIYFNDLSYMFADALKTISTNGQR